MREAERRGSCAYRLLLAHILLGSQYVLLKRRWTSIEQQGVTSHKIALLISDVLENLDITNAYI
jgi:hypothetical protein